MTTLDPDDPRPPYVQITNALRAAILTKTLAPGERLPSQGDLTKRYEVSRATVQRALRDLQEEGLLVARQGSGVYVRSRTERPMELRPHIEQAFESEAVTLDFSGFSAETLHSAIREPIDRIRAGHLRPASITVRILVPDTRKPQAIPSAVDPSQAEGDKPRERAHKIMLRNIQGIIDAVTELETLGLVQEARARVRVYDSSPTFKLYILNQRETFFGFYPIVPNTVSIEGRSVQILDVLGLDAVLFSHSRGDDEARNGTQWVEQSQLWFDSMWDNLAEDFMP